MLMVYVVRYNKDGIEQHKEPIRGHTMESEALHTKSNHERAMTQAPGTRDRNGEYLMVEIRDEG